MTRLSPQCRAEPTARCGVSEWDLSGVLLQEDVKVALFSLPLPFLPSFHCLFPSFLPSSDRPPLCLWQGWACDPRQTHHSPSSPAARTGPGTHRAGQSESFPETVVSSRGCEGRSLRVGRPQNLPCGDLQREAEMASKKECPSAVVPQASCTQILSFFFWSRLWLVVLFFNHLKLK